MAKRRFNEKRIASSPALKKRMAKFCAHIDVRYGDERPTVSLEDILFKGYRGFISLSEEELGKEFDKRFQLLVDKFTFVQAQEEQKKNDKWYRKSDTVVDIELWHEEGQSIANEIFEGQFL